MPFGRNLTRVTGAGVEDPAPHAKPGPGPLFLKITIAGVVSADGPAVKICEQPRANRHATAYTLDRRPGLSAMGPRQEVGLVNPAPG